MIKRYYFDTLVLPPYRENKSGRWCEYSDHVADIAKKEEVIAVAKEALEKINKIRAKEYKARFIDEAFDIEYRNGEEMANIAREAKAKMEEMEK